MRSFRSEEGSALVEVALALPLMALLLAGTINYGIYAEAAMQVDEAANAGAAYGTLPGNQRDTTGMQNAAKAASPKVTGLGATATNLYTCSAGGTLSTTVPTCTGNPLLYVQVTTSASVAALVGIVGLPKTITVNGSATYRVPWIPAS